MNATPRMPALLVLCATLAWTAPGQAADPFDGWAPVDEAVLGEARGGFERGDGLLVSLSVDRMLSLNGDVVASSRLAVEDIAAAAAGGMPAGLQAMAVGDGNALLLAANGPLAGLVLQNSANDQLIRGQTTINTTVNTLSTLKYLNFSDSLRQALSTAIVPR